ncbi:MULTISPECIES: ATP-binding protein [unclassified Ensifer]|uniref:ATP-binding protein n=1 Tax=unclassified Ensifer TaxID=2633371 RepID=UPI000813978C|nr:MULTISPECIES: ATP-binding protein [unclassified Ensifer]OCP09224.1 two-component sensor histidine kinase [Ensifer sp. LC13]OCP10412.1 two-component sensor histidine kinase [Ensifer sp. LC11]OCP13988.1 two-component sensor histidine kinase [Ensifer sp. LC14]OCP32472.1 two-component sensor histidine kinase [Ensifer sp. LC499]
MASFDGTERGATGSSENAWRRFTRWLRRRLPMGLYARSLLIVIIPMVLLQSVVAFIFMERHWQLVTQRLSAAVTGDIAAIVDLIDTFPADRDIAEIIRIARDQLDLNISVDPPGELPPPRPSPFLEILDQILGEEISNQVRRPFWIDTVGNSKLVEIRIKLDDGRILRVYARRNQAYASNTHIFLVWMVAASLVLLTIAILFLRGQIRPILALTKAAESFGKGQKIDDFAPRGADEIRRAGLAFILMRERIERQIEQRTAMLTGVSHDLRTILTRFKLQLALAGNNPDLEGLNQDVEDMQNMLEGYIAFARGEAEEDVGHLKLSDLMVRLAAEAELLGKSLTTSVEGEDEVRVRPNAFTRLVANLASNAYRYASTVNIDARHSAKWITITIDDDGPGIPERSREDVFKPFFRLDEARNLDSSGTGLGLAIARDIARSHGGNVTLGDSPLGGLRATVRVPA